MRLDEQRYVAADDFKRVLRAIIKRDIASAVEEELGDSNLRLHNDVLSDLTSDEKIDALIREMAQEEIQDAVTRGEQIPAHLMFLAGFPISGYGRC